NCIEEVPTHRDAITTFKLLGHLSLLLHENPKTVLVNAVGGGVTLGAVTKHDVTVDAVDIVPDVRDAMALFAKENDNVLQRSNWRRSAGGGPHSPQVLAAALRRHYRRCHSPGRGRVLGIVHPRILSTRESEAY